MSATVAARRLLRPRYVFHSGGYIWIVDDYQPVAALFNPHSTEFVGFVSWAALPPKPPGARGPTIVGDSNGLWIQNHENGPIIHVGVDGIEHAEYTGQRTLVCAGASGAWCMQTPRHGTDIAPTVDAPPRRRLGKPPLLVALPGGGVRTVRVDGPLVSLNYDETSLFVGLEHAPWTRVPVSGVGRQGFELRYSSSVVRVPLDGPIPEQISTRTHPVDAQQKVGYTSEYADQAYNEAHYRKRAVNDSIRWHWGGNPINHENTLIRAYQKLDARPMREIELDGWRGVHGATAFDRLWLVAFSNTTRATERRVLVGSINENTMRPVETVDITDHCWPLGPEPLDHTSYVRSCLRHFEGLRFSAEVEDVHARYVGCWPTGQIHVSFRHSAYPDLRLVRRINMYYEDGARIENLFSYADVGLMESAGTRAYPPPAQAVDGVLYF